jgi:hypothetical protein
MRKLIIGGPVLAAAGILSALALGAAQSTTPFTAPAETFTAPDGRQVTVPSKVYQVEVPTVTVTQTVTVTETTPAPLPGLGGSLPARLPQSTGPIIVVTGSEQLNTQLASAPNGATIRLHGGTYAGVLITRNASATAPITLEPYPGEAVRFVASPTQQYPLRISGSYIRIRNVEITDPAGCSSANVYFLGHDVEFDHVDIHGNGTVGGCPGPGVSGISSSSSSSNLQVYNSKIHDVGVSDNLDHGWYMQGSNHVLANSLIYGITKGYGIQVYPVAANCLITNNTIVDNTWKAGIIVGGTNVHDNLFVNNIVAFSNPSDYAIRGYSNGTNNVVRDSVLWSPSTILPGGGIVVGANVRNVDPQFANRAAHDYHAGANAAGGDAAYMPPTDIDGNPRTRLAVGAYA